jgi:hypothetical protein
MTFKDWREFDESEWEDILEAIDPDWADHFIDAEMGLEFYDEYTDEEGLTAAQVAVKEYNSAEEWVTLH